MNKKLKVIELFAGIGSQTQALKNIGIEHDVVAISEIDKYAIKSYESIHGSVLNLGDITKINEKDIPDCDLITYSFPCTDISISGYQKGIERNSGTKSSLLWECERIFNYKRPKYLLLENVKNLISKKYKPNFDKWLSILEKLGYNNYYQILNAKDYGIPQNRERIFVISIHKDVDDGSFSFPKKQPLNLTLKDLLEENVDDKFYLSQKYIDRFQYKPIGENIIGTTKMPTQSIGQRELIYHTNNIIGTLTANDYKNPKRIIEIDLDNYHDLQSKFLDDDLPLFKLRKLTPKECWRLMVFSDEQFKKAESVCSNTQLYKQAGNSIVVNVLEFIFKQMFIK